MKKAALLLIPAFINAMEESNNPQKPVEKTYAIYCQLNDQLYDLHQEIKHRTNLKSDSIESATKKNKNAWKEIKSFIAGKQKDLNKPFSPVFGGQNHTLSLAKDIKRMGGKRYLRIMLIDEIDESGFCVDNSNFDNEITVEIDKASFEKELSHINYITTILSQEEYLAIKQEEDSDQALINRYETLAIKK